MKSGALRTPWLIAMCRDRLLRAIERFGGSLFFSMATKLGLMTDERPRGRTIMGVPEVHSPDLSQVRT